MRSFMMGLAPRKISEKQSTKAENWGKYFVCCKGELGNGTWFDARRRISHDTAVSSTYLI